jgi:hypothetical protein
VRPPGARGRALRAPRWRGTAERRLPPEARCGLLPPASMLTRLLPLKALAAGRDRAHPPRCRLRL